jgi:hypothetical protein
VSCPSGLCVLSAFHQIRPRRLPPLMMRHKDRWLRCFLWLVIHAQQQRDSWVRPSLPGHLTKSSSASMGVGSAQEQGLAVAPLGRRGGSGERSVARLGESTHTRCGRGPASAHGADQAAPTRQPSCSHRDHCPDTSRRDARDERDLPATPVPRWGHPSSTPTALTQHLWNQMAMAKPVVNASDGGVWLWEAVCSPSGTPADPLQS